MKNQIDEKRAKSRLEIPIIIGAIYEHVNGIRLQILGIKFESRLNKTIITVRYTNNRNYDKSHWGCDINDFGRKFLEYGYILARKQPKGVKI